MKTSCHKCEKMLGLYVYGELPEKDKHTLESHVKTCAACAAQLTRYRQTFEIIQTHQPPTPIPDWEDSWLAIRQNMIMSRRQQERRQRVYFPVLPVLKWAGALAATLVIFTVGLLVGLKLKSGAPAPNDPKVASFILVQEFQEHIENIKPVLIEYANYWRRAESPPDLPVEKARVLDLLKQNQLLLCRIPGDNNRQMQQLLNELNSILTQIALLSWEDPESLDHIKQMIRKKGLLFKMEALRPVDDKEMKL